MSPAGLHIFETSENLHAHHQLQVLGKVAGRQLWCSNGHLSCAQTCAYAAGSIALVA